MSAVEDFKSKFDEQGRFREGDDTLDVKFATKGGVRFSGKLHFHDGLCVRAEMEGGGDWRNPDDSPLHGVRFLLDFGEEGLYGVPVYKGRVIHIEAEKGRLTKQDFLNHLRIARSLFSPRVAADGAMGDTKWIEDQLRGASLWLTPRAVSGFNVDDFWELGPDRQAELRKAVQDFLAVATQVAPNKPATTKQYEDARAALDKVLQILESYLPVSDEARQVEEAIESVQFPRWVLNWNYELASDTGGTQAVWVNIFVDEQALKTDLGKAASKLTSEVQQALDKHQIERRPYIRLRTALEHKVG